MGSSPIGSTAFDPIVRAHGDPVLGWSHGADTGSGRGVARMTERLSRLTERARVEDRPAGFGPGAAVLVALACVCWGVGVGFTVLALSSHTASTTYFAGSWRASDLAVLAYAFAIPVSIAAVGTWLRW